MKSDPLVTIIIPVYNAERYLSECCKSVLNQSYKHIELILIDDGSTDDSKFICDIFAKQDQRVRVFHQNNSGVSAARNVGLKNSQGEYILFVDADDELTDDSIKSRVELIQSNDIGISSYKVINDDNVVIRKMPKSSMKFWRKNEAILNLFSDCEIGYQGYLWNKIYKNSIIKNNRIFFKKGIAYNEDQLFNLQYLLRCKKIVISNKCVYLYKENNKSAMGSIKNIHDNNSKKYLTEFEAFNIMKHILINTNREAYVYCVDNEVRRAIAIYSFLGVNSFHTRLKLMSIIYKDIITVFFSNCRMPFLRKVKLIFHGILLR